MQDKLASAQQGSHGRWVHGPLWAPSRCDNLNLVLVILSSASFCGHPPPPSCGFRGSGWGGLGRLQLLVPFPGFTLECFSPAWRSCCCFRCVLPGRQMGSLSGTGQQSRDGHQLLTGTHLDWADGGLGGILGPDFRVIQRRIAAKGVEERGAEYPTVWGEGRRLSHWELSSVSPETGRRTNLAGRSWGSV